MDSAGLQSVYLWLSLNRLYQEQKMKEHSHDAPPFHTKQPPNTTISVKACLNNHFSNVTNKYQHRSTEAWTALNVHMQRTSNFAYAYAKAIIVLLHYFIYNVFETMW